VTIAPIEIEDLTKSYGQITAIRHVSLEVGEGEVFGFLGPNGAGKSTTIKILVGLVDPNSGTARVLGHDVTREGVQARESIGYLPEVVGLYEEMTARQYLRYTGRFYGFTDSEIERRAEQLLTQVSLEHVGSRRVSTFSKGMRQRLALAGAMFHEPQVLVLDEPLTGLDPEGVIKMRSAIRRLGEDRTVFVSSHELHAVEELCDRVAVLDDGRIEADAPTDELTRTDPPRYVFEVGADAPSPDEVMKSMRECQPVGAIEHAPDGRQDAYRVWVVEPERVDEVLERLIEAGVPVRSLGPDWRTLKDVFIDLTGGLR
jgi:ABC-2 type transport system ATP-binding protein